MNNSLYINKRMEGVEIAESMLYKDCEKPHCSSTTTDKYFQLINNQPYRSFCKEATTDKKLINNDIYNMDVDKVGNYCSQSNSKDCKWDTLCLEKQSIEYQNALKFQNNSAMTNSAMSEMSNLSEENSVIDHLVRSTFYFRPISPDIFNKSNQSNYKTFMNLPNSCSNSLKSNAEYNGITKSSNAEYLSSNQPAIAIEETKTNLSGSQIESDELDSFKMYSHLKYENMKSLPNDSNNYDNQSTSSYSQTILNKIFVEESTPLQTDTLCDSRFYMYDNNSNLLSQTSLKWENCSESHSMDELKKDISDKKEVEQNHTVEIVKSTFPNQSIIDATNNVTATISYTTPTITIPRGSYIFIPLSAQNYKLRESQSQSTANINLPSVSLLNTTIGLNKLIIGCYPVINQIQDLKLPKNSTQENSVTKNSSSTNNLDNWKTPNTMIQNPVFTQHNNIAMISKKFECSEFNHYLENVIECHKVLVKEKNKIWMDRSFLKDDKLKHIINLNPNYEKGLCKLEKELNSIKNSLFEIKSLLSKIEVLRGVSFIDQVYSTIQNSSELIQKFHRKNFDDFNFRNQNQNLTIDSEAKIQIENLKQLCCDLEKIRNFLWATYKNLNFDQQRHLLVSLNKLKSWVENKANMKNSLKLKATNLKNQIQSGNVEPFISCHNLINNSTKQSVKLENNSLTVPRHPFAIPVSRYPQIPTRMTTIVHGFSNPTPINTTQFSYLRAPISNFTSSPLINTNKFPMGSNCRISYGTQPQIYTATPILASTQNTNSPRNFLFTQSSLVTPIIYQNSNRQIINNGSLNYMIYSPNTQII